jgi:serine protease Do
MTGQERSAAGMDHGLVVEQSVGPAARAGIEPGDIVLGIDGEPARSVDQVKSALRSHPKSVALLIERNGQRLFVPVQVG